MRILQIVEYLTGGGLEKLVLDLSRHGGNDSHIAAMQPGDASVYKSKLGSKPGSNFSANVHILDKRPKIDLSCAKKLKHIIHELEPDIIHTHSIGPLFYSALAGVGWKTPVPLVHTTHDAWHLQQPRQKLLTRLSTKLSNPKLIAVSSSVASQWQQHFSKQQPMVVNNGIDLDYFAIADKSAARDNLGIQNHITTIGTAGRLERVKGHAILLRAFAKVSTNAQLLLAGDGSELNNLKTLAKHLGIEHKVHFLSKIDDMANYYQALDLFCLPSLAEGQPLAALEAQACGLPVILTDVGGNPSCMAPGSGILVKANDVAALAASIESQLLIILNNPEQVTPRNFICQNFDIKQTTAAYNSIYEQLLNPH